MNAIADCRTARRPRPPRTRDERARPAYRSDEDRSVARLREATRDRDQAGRQEADDRARRRRADTRAAGDRRTDRTDARADHRRARQRRDAHAPSTCQKPPHHRSPLRRGARKPQATVADAPEAGPSDDPSTRSCSSWLAVKPETPRPSLRSRRSSKRSTTCSPSSPINKDAGEAATSPMRATLQLAPTTTIARGRRPDRAQASRAGRTGSSHRSWSRRTTHISCSTIRTVGS